MSEDARAALLALFLGIALCTWIYGKQHAWW